MPGYAGRLRLGPFAIGEPSACELTNNRSHQWRLLQGNKLAFSPARLPANDQQRLLPFVPGAFWQLIGNERLVPQPSLSACARSILPSRHLSRQPPLA